MTDLICSVCGCELEPELTCEECADILQSIDEAISDCIECELPECFECFDDDDDIAMTVSFDMPEGLPESEMVAIKCEMLRALADNIELGLMDV